MGRIRERLDAMGLALPGPPKPPPGMAIPFRWVRVHRNRAFASGHGPLTPDGTPRGPFGSVPGEVALADAQVSAQAALLSLLGSLEHAVGDLDRVAAWLMVQGHVNAEPGYPDTTLVMNPVSEVLVELFGEDVGSHARTAIGSPALPLNLPVIVAAEVELTAG